MSIILGTSVEGLPIEAILVGSDDRPTVLLFGGFHGDEPKSVYVAQRFAEQLCADSASGLGMRWVVVPVVNPDGYERRKRRNAHKVDINRNFPTQNWVSGSKRSRMFGGSAPACEPETRAVIDAIERLKPRAIVTIHSIGSNRFCNNYDGPAAKLAKAISRINGYPVTKTIGYPTPGSFGTWAGVERNIPTVTLELPSHHSPKRCWEDNRAVLVGVFETVLASGDQAAGSHLS